MSIENNFDVPFIAALSLKEKQIQQNYRPIIAVHKWFARRPGSLFRGLTLAEFGDQPVSELYFKQNHFPRRTVADPFMGGGTPLIEANRTGCDVLGFDINPMAAWIVREELEHLDLPAYIARAREFQEALRAEIEPYYRTDCPLYGDTDVPVKYFLWVKTMECGSCGETFDLFPGYRIADDSRHPKHVLVCAHCRELNEVSNPKEPGNCSECQRPLQLKGPAKRGRCSCPHCGHINTYPRPESGPLRHRLFALEYYNPKRKAGHKGRFFKRADVKDLERAAAAERHWDSITPEYVPEQDILEGDETDRLHRWGYRKYKELFSYRQLLGLELSCRLISEITDERVRHALATNLSDLLRYQNLLCRYDMRALKSLDIFSVHGFPVGLIQCESNLLGIVNEKKINVGSGGWSNIIEKYTRAKRYCDAPFEIRRVQGRNVQVPIEGEWIGERFDGAPPRKVEIRCASSTTVDVAPESLDAVFTDPPYFGNVQYGELMDFCYVWLRHLVGHEAEGFQNISTRLGDELTGSVSRNWGLARFAEGIGEVYRRMADALKPGAPLAFTFHHNKQTAYAAIGVAILDSGLGCTATFPCPAEMGGSIHIHGTGSSIVDTVFVCRKTEEVPRRWLCHSRDELLALIHEDLESLRKGGVKPTQGDARCILWGHLTRLAVSKLRSGWDCGQPTSRKLCAFETALMDFGQPEDLLAQSLGSGMSSHGQQTLFNYDSESEADVLSF